MTVKCGKDLFLRELTQDDYDRILEIVRACAAHSTRILYHSYKNVNFKHNMNDIFEKDFLSKLKKNFKHFDNIMTKEMIITGTQQFTEFLNKIEEAFKFFPDDHLFFPYGPIQPPFEENVKEFLEAAIDTQTSENRKYFRLGIVVDNLLIGCFTIDFNKHKILGYPNETTGDPGIFIIPNCRINNGIHRWTEVFSLATKIVESFYPYNENEIPISATTHRVNMETGNILSPDKAFTEYKGAILHGKYGERRFFTINKKDFIDKFRLDGTDYQGVIT